MFCPEWHREGTACWAHKMILRGKAGQGALLETLQTSPLKWQLDTREVHQSIPSLPKHSLVNSVKQHSERRTRRFFYGQSNIFFPKEKCHTNDCLPRKSPYLNIFVPLFSR